MQEPPWPLHFHPPRCHLKALLGQPGGMLQHWWLSGSCWGRGHGASQTAGTKPTSSASTGAGLPTKGLELDPGTKPKSRVSRKPGTNFGSHEELRELFVFS